MAKAQSPPMRAASAAWHSRVALVLIALLALAILLWPGPATDLISRATGITMDRAGLAILWFCSGLLLLCLLLALSPVGRLRLGAGPPEFSTAAWLAMLFAAGMGSGLVFWGVAEPLTHLASAPLQNPAGSVEAAAEAMAITWFHWGLHAWAIYAVAALAIAWFAYRRGRSECPSGSLHGLLGAKLARLADALALGAVVFGVAGALANGIILLDRGLAQSLYMWLPAAPGSGSSKALALLLLTSAFMLSAASGLRQGIRRLSQLNILLALLLLLLLLALTGPLTAMNSYWHSGLAWLQALPEWSIRRIGDPASSWSNDWTITYLLWWIAWTPFVGLFIARISRGRRVRDFLAGVLVVPVLFSFVWFAILGGGAMAWNDSHGGLLSAALNEHYTQPVFAWFQALGEDGMPLIGQLLSLLLLVLLFIFLVTSADSAAYVLAMIGSGGTHQPALRQRLVWGAVVTLLTAGLLLRNDVDVNRAIAILGAIPFTVVLVLQVLALLRDMLGRRHRDSADG